MSMRKESMKKRIKNWINFILITFLLLAAGFVLYSVTVYKQNYPNYSTYSTTGTGIKALYLLSQKMGFRVTRNHYPAKFVEKTPVMVIYRPADTLFNEPDEQKALKEWLLQGNTMILIPDTDTISELWIFDTISEQMQWHEVINTGKITATWYGLENGRICVMDRPDDFLNEELKDSDAAIAFIQALEKAGSRLVVFNEYYRYLQEPAPGFWELLGTAGQLAAVQLLLVVLMVIIRGWKPFGRTRNEQETVKRPENEVQKALSGLYIRMRAYPLVLTNYYGYFTRKYGRFLSTQGLLQEKARRMLAACGRYIEENRKNKSELVFLVNQLDKLEEELRGRNRSSFFSGSPLRREKG